MDDHNDELVISAMAIARIVAAINIARRKGWTFEAKPDERMPEQILGRRKFSDHQDVVHIDLRDVPIAASGGRFALGALDSTDMKASRIATGTPDKVITEVLAWERE